MTIYVWHKQGVLYVLNAERIVLGTLKANSALVVDIMLNLLERLPKTEIMGDGQLKITI